MTKEELRSKILELEEAMREDSKSTTAKLSDEWDELMSKLEDVIYDELEGVAVKIVTERIVDKYDVDTGTLMQSIWKVETQRNHLRQQPRSAIAVGRQILQKEY